MRKATFAVTINQEPIKKYFMIDGRYETVDNKASAWKPVAGRRSPRRQRNEHISTEQLADMIAREVVNSIQWDCIFGRVARYSDRIF